MANFITELLNSAQTDLRASEILHETKLYAKAVFLFQQSVEKTNKALALMLNKRSPEELKSKVGHHTSKIYESHFKKEEERYRGFVETQGIFPKLGVIQSREEQSKYIEFTVELQRKLIEIRSGQVKYKQITEEEIDSFLDQIDKLTSEIRSETPEFENITQEEYESSLDERLNQLKEIFGEYLPKEYDKGFEELKKNKEIIMSLARFQILFMYHFMVPYFECMLLAILTTPHVDIRYPSPDTKFIPDRFYNKKLPFVKKIPDLFEYQQECIQELYKLRKFIEIKE